MTTIFMALCFLTGLSWAQGDLRINEILASNNYAVEDDYRDYDDWIEIYNASATDINLAGYYLSDDAAEPTKWKIPSSPDSLITVPAGGYLLFWADGESWQGANHLGFQLSSSGEQVVLTEPDGLTLVDSFSFPQQYADISYGRSADDPAALRFFSTVTPLQANGAGFKGVTPPPVLSVRSAFFDAPQTVSLSSDFPGALIRYTLDGSLPEDASPQYQQPLNVAALSVLRASVFKENYIAGRPASAIYFFNQQHALPVLALVTDPGNMWDEQSGIYENWSHSGRRWERPVKNIYFKNKILQFETPSGIRIQGSTSRKQDKKSFRLFFRKGLGAERLEYPLFRPGSVTSFKNIVLRAGYDDDISPTNPAGTLLRDPVVSEIWERTGHLTSQGNFAVLYINKEYWGIYNLRESINEYFIQDHMHYDDFDLIRFDKKGPELKYGSWDEWNAFWEFIQNADFSRDEDYRQAEAQIDIDDLISLQALVQGSQYRSWGWGTSTFKEKNAQGKWRYTIWDMDRALTSVTWNGFSDYNDTYGSGGEKWGNLMMKKLLVNSEFRKRFINRVADYCNTFFTPQNFTAVIDSLAAIIEPEIPKEADRWNSSLSKWQNNVAGLRSFADNRSAYVRSQMAAAYGLPGSHTITLEAPKGQGTVRLNSIHIKSFPWSGIYFEDVPVRITAIPAAGYRFAGWSDDALPQTPDITLNLTEERHVQALFEVQPSGKKVRLIAPSRMRANRSLPAVVQLLKNNGRLADLVSDTLQLNSGGALAADDVYLHKGVGTLQGAIQTESGFQLQIAYEDFAAATKTVQVSDSFAAQTYGGTLSGSEIVWDAQYDRLVTSDLTIPAGSHLIIEAGTRILLDANVNVFVNGQLTVSGAMDDPVLFISRNDGQAWGGIEFLGAQARISNCLFVNAGGDAARGWAHMNLQPVLFVKNNGQLTLDHVYVLYSPGKALGAQSSRLTFTDGVIAFTKHGGEFHNSLIHYNRDYIMNIPDDVVLHDSVYVDYDNDGMHIDYLYSDAQQVSKIENSVFYHGRDDAIDHNGANVEVNNCWLEDWQHEGVAASGGQQIKVFNTLAMNNGQGFEAGHGSPNLIVDHCVAVDNSTGARFGDSYSTPVTGHLTITNTIFYGNKNNIRNYVFNLGGPSPGSIDVSYSMTNDNYDIDEDYNTYPYCITGTPQFDARYYLLPYSDGAAQAMGGANMGLIDTLLLQETSTVVINEIMYKAADVHDTKDWIELYNPQSVDQNIGSWQLKDDNDSHQFIFPAGTILPAWGYAVISKDTAEFRKFHPDVKPLFGDLGFGFGAGDQVRLFAATGEAVDQVTYGTSTPWPSSPNGGGASLELKDFMLDNALAESWAASALTGGTPGALNSVFTALEEEKPQLPQGCRLYQNYPNPFNPKTTIHYELRMTNYVELSIYNLLGQKVATLVSEKQQAGTYKVEWNASSFASGVYYYRLSTGNGFSQTRKLILLK